MMNEIITPESIIYFWYSDRIKSKWFNSTEKLDKEIKDNYEHVWKNAIRGEYKDWQNSAEGCLALAIIFDQFPLNMFRGEVESFSTEGMAVRVTKHAVEKEFSHLVHPCNQKKQCLQLTRNPEKLYPLLCTHNTQSII